MLQANKFVFKKDAVKSGVETGNTVGIVLVLIVVFLYYTDQWPLCTRSTVLLSLALFLVSRYGAKAYMSSEWEKYEKERQCLQVYKNVDPVKAFEMVRDGYKA